MNGSRVLITGGCGFVGRRLVRRLVSLGAEITIVDNLSTGHHPLDWPAIVSIPESAVTFLHLDLRTYVKQAPCNFDFVIHCAAVVGGRLTIEGDPLAVATDLAIDADLFNWLAKAERRPRRTVYFSSSAAYPIWLQTSEGARTLTESDISFASNVGVPDMTYGWAKLTGEFLAQHAINAYGLDVVVYRPFSGYGEEQDLTYPFPSIVRRVLNRERPIVVWGSGKQARDFIHIEDVVDAVMGSMLSLAPGNAMNIGSGIATSFAELAEACCAAVGHTAEIINDATKPEGVFFRVSDNSKMRKFVSPKIALDQGIQLAVDYLHRELCKA